MASQKIKIILNPISKPLKILLFLQPAIELFENAGYEVNLQKCIHYGDAEIEAKKAAESGEFNIIVAAGGDGTFNQVINGIVGTNIPLGLIALGTSNVLMRSLGFPLNPIDAAKIILEGNLKKWDLGIINERYFAIMASCGFDALATEKTNLKLKRVAGKYAYIFAAIQNLLTYKPYPMRVVLNGQETQYQPIFVNVANAPLYGGSYKLTPNAKMDDGLLDVFLFDSSSFSRLLYFALRVILNLPLNMREISIARAKTVELQAPGRVPYQVDGDVFGSLPVKVSIRPRAIPIITPKNLIKRHEYMGHLHLNHLKAFGSLLSKRNHKGVHLKNH